MVRRIFLFAVVAMTAIMASRAQTAGNTAAAIRWILDSGTATEQPAFVPETASQFFEKTEIAVGSGLGTPVAKTSEVESITQTMFPVKSKTSSATDANAVRFLVTLKDGIAFTPTAISFKAFRWKTDKGNFDASWLCDDSATPLASGVRPNRGAGSGAAAVSAYSYDLSGTQASEQQFGLCINIYNFDVAADKGLSLGDIVIEGTLYGTVGQPLTYTLTLSVSPEGAGTVSASPAGPAYQSGQQVTVTQQPADGYIFTGWRTETGKTLSAAAAYTFNIKGNTALTATYVTRESLLVNDYIIVSNIDELRAAITAVNGLAAGNPRHFIFMKNGDYDYGTYKNPESGADPYGRDTIVADNVSLIGQSTNGVNVHIQPTMASVSRTSPIVINGTGTYLQDFTLQNNFAYGGNDGQAAALMDKGHHTIGKNMSLVSRQDTYYSNTDFGQLYFEDSHFEGTVDYICGRGDVFFNRCDLVCVNRQPTQGDYKGDTHIAAPYTIAEDFNAPGGHGYIFMDCHVDCKSKTWDFGRGWRGWPKAAFLNTVLTADACHRLGNDQTSGKATDGYAVVRDIDYSLRVGTKGIQSSSDSHYMQFYEYNTMDEQGNCVSPTTNILTFTASDSQQYETILQADQTERFQLHNVYPDWTPDEDCRQVAVSECRLEGTTLSWQADATAKAFLIERNGEFVAIVNGTETTFSLSGSPTDGYTVRAANMMGGFGTPTAAVSTTGITVVSCLPAGSSLRKYMLGGRLVIEKDGMRFNAQGQEVRK
ncbi:MAG: hypothetical protein IJT98_09810 [Prevotella sp.]|nr:hypothetical protein [Prevotella sp.]